VNDRSRDVSGLCRRAGMSRQNYYAKRKRRKRRGVEKDVILSLVKSERKVQPRVGVRKLHRIIAGDLRKHGVRIGRDRLFDILREESMLIGKKKAFKPKTTNSKHTLPVFRNLLKLYEPTAPNQVWVSDITYIRTEEGFAYAALITDIFSRKIVGWHIGDKLEAIGALKALGMAIRSLPSDRYPIHHSDRGSQYCCHEYVKKLKKRGLSISMTEENHCYENATAERVNGILKDEYYIDALFKSKKDAHRAFKSAVNIYNNRRPHMSLNYMVPSEAHERKAA
jgi:transposase InsO family protein